MARPYKRKGRDGWTAPYQDPATGRRRQKQFPTRREAEAFSARMEGEQRARALGQPVAHFRKEMFGDYAGGWLRRHGPSLRPSSRRFYEMILRVHLNPRLGHVDLKAIDRELVLDLRAALAADEKRAPRSVNHVLTTLKTILNDAVVNGYLVANPAMLVKPLAKARREMDFLEPTELELMLGCAKLRWRPLFLTAALTGLRRGELLALGWEHVDFANGALWVRRQLLEDRSFALPKSEKSIRTVDMAPIVMETLRGLPSRFAGELVFPKKDGRPMDADSMVRLGFSPALRKAGLRRVPFHSLRHSYAAMCIAANLHPKYIQEQMGHASMSTTLDLYGHLMKGRNPSAAGKVQDVFLGKSGDNSLTSSGGGDSSVGAID